MVLLIDDDGPQVSAIERLLASEGREVEVAGTVAEALAAFGRGQPELILLAPGIESGRGHFVLEERVVHPQVRAVPVLLLGESVPGFEYPVAALPPGEALLEQVRQLAPPASAELLAGAERALGRARADHEAKTAFAQRSQSELAEQLRQTSSELEAVRAESSRREEARRDLELGLEALQREHEQTQEALTSLSRDHAEATSRRDALKSKLDAALERAQQRTEAALKVEEQLLERDQAVEAEQAARAVAEAHLIEATERIGRLEAELAAARAVADTGSEAHRLELAAQAASLDEQLQRVRRQLETSREAHRIELATLKVRHEDEVAEREAAFASRFAGLQVELDGAKAGAKLDVDTARSSQADLEKRLAAAQHELEEQRETARREQQLAAAELEHRAAQARAELDQLRAEHGSSREKLVAEHGAELEIARLEADSELAEAAARARAEREAAEARHQAEHAAAAAELAGLREAETWTRAQLEAERERAAASAAELERARAGLEVGRADLVALRAQLTTALAAVAAETQRADAALARAAEAHERAQELERRTHLIASSEPEAAPLAIVRTGALSMGELARLAMQLWAARADVRVDLSIAGGTRRLWLRRGALVAAWSSLPSEALSVRARRDGLIDARSEAELREVRDASPASLLEELRQRGLVRKSEVAGLVKRWAEEIALEALGEAVCTYRLHDEAPGADLPLAEDARPLPALAAQALKRSLPWEAQLQLVGGPEAVPRRTRVVADLEVLGLNERERDLVGRVDGSTSVESLIVAAGLKPERGYQTLAVAKIAGLIAVGDPRAAPEADGRGDGLPTLAALDAKHEQVQQTDYFAILGLPRTAGADDVREARERLGRQYDPLQWSGHPDPDLLRRAREVFASIEEAARTLQDDRLRAEYARHLVE
ncbi:MAG: hypothetical protein IPJ65_07375 [Archangiaceae bacterium]|nr:hypothetical protein [Archangiaceae bacterium]